MGPMIAGAILQGVGGLFAGAARNKAAKRHYADITDRADDAIRLTADDQRRAIEYRDRDQSRLDAEAGKMGYDLGRLRDEALQAGFNPLTVLAATGAANYARTPGEVLTTPFVSMADAAWNKANLLAGLGQAKIETAGYFGDALSAGASAYVDASDRMAQTDLLRDELGQRSAPSRIDGPRSPFGAPVAKMKMRPKANPLGTMTVFDPQGYRFEISRSWARRNGFEPGDQFAPGDYENWLGESGQAASAATSVGAYEQVLKAPYGSPAVTESPGWYNPGVWSPSGMLAHGVDYFYRRMTGRSVEDAFGSP